MTRLTFLLAVGVAAGLAAAAADPKPKPVVTADPAEAKDSFDFIHQGEYEGTLTESGKAAKAGMRLVAQGGGKFMGKVYKGGLPGAGAAAGKPAFTFTGARAGDRVVCGAANLKVEGADGTLTVHATGDAPADGEFQKVARTSPTMGARPPAGAVVLFAKAGDEANWAGGKLTKLSDGEFLGVGGKTKAAFAGFTAHAEFRLPWMPDARGQGRGNSGFYLQDRYEIQILDSFGLTGENNECGGVYTLHKPTVNMCLPPLVWQTYDITFSPAEFATDGKKTASARLTLKHNGVTVHDDVELSKATGGGQPEKPTPGPIQLQNHGNPVVFRNVWVVESKK